MMFQFDKTSLRRLIEDPKESFFFFIDFHETSTFRYNCPFKFIFLFAEHSDIATKQRQIY